MIRLSYQERVVERSYRGEKLYSISLDLTQQANLRSVGWRIN